MIKEFKEFILRGNVLDLAVGVIIGTAFTGLVTSLVNNIFNPFIGLFTSSGALAHMEFTIGKAKFSYGAFLNDVINFIIVAFVLFLIIKTINKLFPTKKEEDEIKEEKINEELQTLREIRDLLKASEQIK